MRRPDERQFSRRRTRGNGWLARLIRRVSGWCASVFVRTKAIPPLIIAPAAPMAPAEPADVGEPTHKAHQIVLDEGDTKRACAVEPEPLESKTVVVHSDRISVPANEPELDEPAAAEGDSSPSSPDQSRPAAPNVLALPQVCPPPAASPLTSNDDESEVGSDLSRVLRDEADAPKPSNVDALEADTCMPLNNFSSPPSDADGKLQPKLEISAEPAGTRLPEDGAELLVTPQQGLPTALAKYRPRLGTRPGPRASASIKVRPEKGTRQEPTTGTLEAELLLSVQPGGWGILLAVLLRRPDGIAEEVTIRLSGQFITLATIDDVFFEPTELPDPAAVLAEGVAFESVGRRWVRTGRRLHIFTGRPGFSGFVTAPRVVIGQENVVFCEAAIAEQIAEICKSVGSAAPVELQGPGVPEGWRCFRNIYPVFSSTQQSVEGIFLALVPLPDAIIDLRGGIPLSRSAWLVGRPPSICVLGASPASSAVTIDGKIASPDQDAHWSAQGWDALGAHTVQYAGLTRTYEISPAPDVWEFWEAHTGSCLSLCGALAALPGADNVLVLGFGPCWLVGARPGEVVSATFLPGRRTTVAAPNFRPVWAIPIPAGRRRKAPKLLASPDEPLAAVPGTSPAAIRQWCQVIRSCVGFPARETGMQAMLWSRYRQAARAIRRRRR